MRSTAAARRCDVRATSDAAAANSRWRHRSMRAQRAQQRRGISPVAFAFGCGLARRGRIRDERARRQRPRPRVRFLEGIGETHVEHDDIRRVRPRARHALDDVFRGDRVAHERRGPLLASVERHEQRIAARLQSVAGEIDERRIVRGELRGECIECLPHRGFIEIRALRHVEAECVECRGHVIGIARCACERMIDIVCIADHEREMSGRVCGRRGRRRRQRRYRSRIRLRGRQADHQQNARDKKSSPHIHTLSVRL